MGLVQITDEHMYEVAVGLGGNLAAFAFCVDHRLWSIHCDTHAGKRTHCVTKLAILAVRYNTKHEVLLLALSKKHIPGEWSPTLPVIQIRKCLVCFYLLPIRMRPRPAM